MQLSSYTFGLRGHDIGHDFPSMCENAVRSHITSIQFAMAKTVQDINFDEIGFNQTVAESIDRSLRECNLSVPVLGCYINPIDGDKERLVDKAEQFNVNIGIEPVWCGTVCSPQMMHRVIRDIGSERIKVILDLSNMLTKDTISSQRKLLDDSFELFGDRIKAVHLKDFDLVDGKKRFAAPGEGLMDIPYLFEQLSDLSEKPAIILDELKLEGYPAAMERLKFLLN